VISLTGWTWEYVGRQMTLPRLYEMQRYWERHPPVGDLVAAYLGYKAPVGRESEAHPANPKAGSYGSPEELMAMFGASGGKVKM
jgi:hypothetical protein